MWPLRSATWTRTIRSRLAPTTVARSSWYHSTVRHSTLTRVLAAVVEQELVAHRMREGLQQLVEPAQPVEHLHPAEGLRVTPEPQAETMDPVALVLVLVASRPRAVAGIQAA